MGLSPSLIQVSYPMCLTSAFPSKNFQSGEQEPWLLTLCFLHFAGHRMGINQTQFMVTEIVMHNDVPGKELGRADTVILRTAHNDHIALIGTKPADVNICGSG